MVWRAPRANVFLQSGLTFKRNMLARTFVPHRLLSLEAFEQLALDWIALAWRTSKTANRCSARR